MPMACRDPAVLTEPVPVAEIIGASKRYPGVLALDAADFSLLPGEVRALLGKNGAGKSTLIRLLTGAETPDTGTVRLLGTPLAAVGEHRTREAAALGVRAVYQELSLVPGMSIAENMFLGAWPARGLVLDHRAMERQAAEALAALGLALHPRREVATLSTAERQLVEIARAFMGAPKLVILDEPTSSLNANEVEHVFQVVRRLAAQGIAVIYVSHRMAEIRQIADSATVVRDGRIIATTPVRDTDTRSIVRMMLGRDEQAAGVPAAAAAANAVTLTVRDLALPPKLAGISFDLHRGEVLGIAGLLGSGRTELLRAIAGLDSPVNGAVSLDGADITRMGYGEKVRHGIGMTPENRKDDGILPLLGVDENIVATDRRLVARHGILSRSRIMAAAKAIIARMDIKTARTDTPIGTLSGGNQQKVVIGRWVHADSRILLLDEPTRGVDVEAKAQIYRIIRALADAGKSIIFVSSEIDELPRVCDRVLVLREGRITDIFQAGAMDADALMAASIADAAGIADQEKAA